LLADLDAWARLGVEGHLEAERPWLPYHRELSEPAARLVGALPSETVVMNSLTVNLHLLMVSFYRPSGARTRIVIEDSAFPSDSYAVRSQARFHGLDPDDAVIRLKPRPGEDSLRTEDVIARLTPDVALVLLGGVNYLTGELLDIPAITAAGRAAGAVVGWDLAHAAGNVPLRLHDWDVDFAAWCSYKYLNAGPGALGRCVFVHERHHGDPLCPGSRAGGAPTRRPVRDGAGVAPTGRRGGVADLQPADPGDGPGAHVAGAVRRGRACPPCASAACGSPATSRPAGRRERRAAAVRGHPARPATPGEPSVVGSAPTATRAR
jgi:kynureninase